MKAEWKKHPRYVEIIGYTSRNEDIPAEVLRQARIELPAGAYENATKEARKIRFDRQVEDSMSESIQKTRRKYASLEELVKATEHYDGLWQVMLAIWLLLLFFSWIGTKHYGFLWYVLLAYTLVGIIPFLYLMTKSAELGKARDEWRLEVLSESRVEELRRQVDTTKARQYLYTLSPREFERTVAKILQRNGYEVETTSYARDYGADAIAGKKDRTYVVQIKKYAEGNLVGRPELQKLQGSMLHYKADGMIFVTLGYFSKPAQEYGKEHGIMLIGGSDLLDMAID